ncbi:MAG: hypothetical protein LAO05_14555 [Acidobacteriia bacterium]|nr:hypothetical protein [Terriglobia bacterium]
MAEEVTRLRSDGPEDRIAFHDLAEIGDEHQLRKDIFESGWFTDWCQGDGSLVLFLDSYDECLLDLGSLHKVLLAELRKCPVERFSLRVACRTADWPFRLEDRLRHLWGDNKVKMLELWPLRREDVASAAEAERIDVEAFMQAILANQAVPLATQPITLKFLLGAYLAHGKLASSATELYEEGCLRLCEEVNEDRLLSGHAGRLPARQRLQVASRVAALQVFCNRLALCAGAPESDASNAELRPSEVVGGDEVVDGLAFNVNRDAINETTATALFASKGPHRLGFAHRSFAEFLAARYLKALDFSPNQVLSLVTGQSDGHASVVPQLAGTVAWLAGTVPVLLRELLSCAPEVVLRGDLATLGPAERAALAAALLAAFDEERLLDVRRGFHEHYAKLNHPGLGKQLLPFIKDKARGPVVRRVAIDIAERCHLVQLQNPLVEVFLDTSDTIETRIQAGWAISRIADPSTRARVRPVLAMAPRDDPDDEMKGCALRALWPGLITAEELFPFLTRPQRSNLLGAYRSFLWDLPTTLRAEDIPPALAFLQRIAPIHSLDPLDDVADGIIKRAVELALEPPVFGALVGHIAHAMKEPAFEWGYRRRSTLLEMLVDKPSLRLDLASALLRTLPTADREWQIAVSSLAWLLGVADIPWMVDQLEHRAEGPIRNALARLISLHFQGCDGESTDLVLAATQRVPLLANELRWAIGPVDLDSEWADNMRSLHKRQQEFESERAARSDLSPPPEVRIVELLGTFDPEHPETWIPIDFELLRLADNRQLIDELNSDLTAGWAWPRLDVETKTRVTKAATEFLLHGEPKPETWLGKNLVGRVAFAGYRVFRLLDSVDPAALANLSYEVWARWACIIVAFPISTGNDEWEAPHRRLVGIAYQRAPESILRTLMTVIDQEAKEGSGYLSILRKFDVWDKGFARALLDKAGGATLGPEALRCLLTVLLQHKLPEALAFAGDLIDNLPEATTAARERAIAAAKALTSTWPEAGWERVWPVISTDGPAGREVLGWLFHRVATEAAVTSRLNEGQLERLYMFLEEEFPGVPYEVRTEVASFVGPADSARMAKQAVLEDLRRRGTRDAVAAIRRLRQSLPHIDWLKWVELDAEQVRVGASWQPPRPLEVMALARSRENTFVEDVHGLLIVIQQSLMRLQDELQCETPAMQFLWADTTAHPRPKDEGALSDFVKLHLERDLRDRGVIVNREVEIRSNRTSQEGERVDIHVDAVRQLPHGDLSRLKVVIEVKGCWNVELKSAMETQLLERYLADNPGAAGIYLVGWFNCPQWSAEDSRRHAASQFDSIEAATDYVGDQAKTLSDASTQLVATVLDVALR